jgi:hypothetical protein
MADKVKKVEYFKIETANKVGEGARILGALRDAGVNLLVFSGFPRGRKAQMDFIPEDAAALRKGLRQAGVSGAERKRGAFLVQGEDRTGAVAEHVEKLASAGINVTAAYGLAAGGGRYAAIIWVDEADINKAAKALGAT